MSAVFEESNLSNRRERDVARATGQLEGTESRENSDPANGPIDREGSCSKEAQLEDDEDEED